DRSAHAEPTGPANPAAEGREAEGLFTRARRLRARQGGARPAYLRPQGSEDHRPRCGSGRRGADPERALLLVQLAEDARQGPRRLRPDRAAPEAARLDEPELAADSLERFERGVEVLALERGRNLHADPRRALRHDR